LATRVAGLAVRRSERSAASSTILFGEPTLQWRDRRHPERLPSRRESSRYARLGSGPVEKGSAALNSTPRTPGTCRGCAGSDSEWVGKRARAPRTGSAVLGTASGCLGKRGEQRPGWGRGAPDVGQGVPVVGAGVPRLGRRLPRAGRHVPDVGRLVPGLGRGVPFSGDGLPRVGRGAPFSGHAAPRMGRRVPGRLSAGPHQPRRSVRSWTRQAEPASPVSRERYSSQRNSSSSRPAMAVRSSATREASAPSSARMSTVAPVR